MRYRFFLYSGVLGLLSLSTGCDGSKSSDAANMMADDMTVVARDARGGQMPRDAGPAPVDAAPAVDGSGGAGGEGGSAGQGGEGGQGGAGGTGGTGGTGGEGGMGGTGGEGGMNVELTPPECGPGVDTCSEVCRWVADCALSGVCELDETDRPLVVQYCERTCNEIREFGEIICQHNACMPTMALMRNDGAFAAICRGEPAPEMVDPVVAQCTALNTCLGTCNSNRACIDQCYMNATPEAQQRFGNIINCVRANQCVNLANQIDQECMLEQCGMELERCFGPQAAPEGEGSCNTLLRCQSDCAEGDNACRRACINETSRASYNIYNEALRCVQENCPNGDVDCQRMNCAEEIDACLEDGRPLGADTCSEISACFWRCPAGPEVGECRRDCQDEGTRESQAAWTDFLNCAADARCANQPACEAACVQEMAACRNAGAVEEDAGVPAEDAGLPVPDAAMPIADAEVPLEDAAMPVADAEVPVEDAAMPGADEGLIQADQGVDFGDAGIQPPPPPENE